MITFYNMISTSSGGFRVRMEEGMGLATAVSDKALAHLTTAMSTGTTGRGAGSEGCSNSEYKGYNYNCLSHFLWYLRLKR